MKHFKFTVISFAIALVALSCTKDNTVNPPAEPVFGQIGSVAKHFEITSDPTFKKVTSVLKGWAYVTVLFTVTCEPGTVTKGDSPTMASLIVEPVGKLIAEGTKDQPIVFPSNQPAVHSSPADLGGLII